MLYKANGDSIKLTDLNWEYATAGWNSPLKNKNVSGGTLNVKGTSYDNGIGTHSQSIILYTLPKDCVRFKAFAGLDKGGTDQTGGATVEFMVSISDPTVRQVDPSKAIANSGRISRTMQREGKILTADITGAAKLYLVVTDAGDNFNYDHGDWINPAIYKDNGDSLLLTNLNWVSATSGWGSVAKDKSLDGNTLKVNGRSYSNGFGVNSYSTIEFDLPEGYTTFKSFCGFDDEVLNAANGVSMEFMVFSQDPANNSTIDIPVDLTALGFKGSCKVRDLWAKTDLGTFTGSGFTPSIKNHGAGLYRISATNRETVASVILSASEQQVSIDDTITLDVTVSGASVSGSVLFFHNDLQVGTLALDSNGEAQFVSSLDTEGTHTFKAQYGGNTIYSSKMSNTVTVDVKKKKHR